MNMFVIRNDQPLELWIVAVFLILFIFVIAYFLSKKLPIITPQNIWYYGLITIIIFLLLIIIQPVNKPLFERNALEVFQTLIDLILSTWIITYFMMMLRGFFHGKPQEKEQEALT